MKKNVFIALIEVLQIALCACVSTKAHYTSEIVVETIDLPNEIEINNQILFEQNIKQYLYIHRSDGKIWDIDVDYPMSMNLEPTLHETAEGFLLDFGENNSKYQFFFKEIKQVPHLVKIGTKEIQPISIESLSEISFLIESTIKEK